MTRQFEGRTAIVLGGGSIGPGWGIGKAISFAYAEEGAHVVVADRDLQSANETLRLIREAGGTGDAVECDVMSDASIESVVEDVVRTRGSIDILYCNVGLGKAGPSMETTAAEWRRFADANLTSLHVACLAALPSMRDRGRGVILATSSIAGIRDVGFPHLAYGATKAAAVHFMRLLATENARYGIRANTIVAGLVDTPRIEKTLASSYGTRSLEEMKQARALQVPLGRMADAFDVASAAVFLASDKASYVTGTELVVDGGLSNTVNRSPYD
ncbi:SDR family NAD(P)-dependent oxidoreductase [Aureimonas mangrovi]|uniref:SDR family NAD(P)-dependent oxidoreductase n=1 Tax=Aureimonas mangrovi TaxID=2758041 RepID=UPI00163DAED7|nr:SDR family NAD(P)-dependent oxidoreductase [Aureimonas mangrovi]